MRTKFDEAAAKAAVGFFPEHLAHLEGQFAGQRFKLLPWQRDDIIRPLFGEMRWDAAVKGWVRRYRTAYIEVPRKNGKSALGAGIALKLLAADGEEGAHIFSVAEDLDQARRIFDMARLMVEADPALASRCKIYNRLIEYRTKAGGLNIYRVIPGDAAGNHGHNPHGVIFDELHTQKTRELWDVMTTGQGARAQPLTIAFTTAGTSTDTICWEQHEYGERIRKGLAADPAFLYVRYGYEEGDDWNDSVAWKRWNPSYGKVISPGFLKAEHAKAAASPARENTFRNLFGNEWTKQVTRYIPMDEWDARPNIQMLGPLAGSCYAGLDVAAEQGLAAFVIVKPDGDGGFDVFPRYWLPGANVEDREHRDGAPYREWARAGVLELTEGNVRDNEAIRAGIVDLIGDLHLEVEQAAYRRTGALELVLALQEEGLTMVPVGATAAAMNEGTTKLLDLVLAGKLRHSGNQALRWEADSLAVKRDADGNVKPDQSRSTVAIPGMLALIRALDRAMRNDDGGESAYESSGLVIA